MNEKANLNIYMNCLREFIIHNQRAINNYIKQGYSEDNVRLEMHKYMMELNKKRLYEVSFQLEVMILKGKG